MPLLLPIVLAVLALIWSIAVYNLIVIRKNRADQCWADIDVELRRRHNLVENLVETVRGYAAHERGTLDEVTEARSRAVALREVPEGLGGEAERGRVEGELGAALRRLFALAEQYPDLKANENFLRLQGSLEELERAIEQARVRYNDAVRNYNVLVEQFPNSLVAGMASVARRDFYGAETGDREAPGVRFG